jgi:very-short-patch-repair endonuclease
MSRRSPQQNPSPLVGEGGVRLRRTPGEGATSPSVQKARSLRGRMTDAERKLWYMLRDRRFAAAKFRRQVPLGNQGFTVVRFWNNDVLTNLRGVFTRLSDVIDANTPHPASQPQAAAMPPSPTRGEGKRSAR